MMTGRTRSVSFTTASAYSSSLAVDLCNAARASRPGCGASRSKAHASAVALVSWPAVSSVISSSRSSRSLIGLPSSWRAASSSDRTSSRSPASGFARAGGGSRRRRARRPRHASAGTVPTGSSGPRSRRRNGIHICTPRCLGQPRQQRAEAGQPLLAAHTENGPQDHLERDRLHARPQLERLAHAASARPRARRSRRSGRGSGAPPRRGTEAAAACAGACGRPRRESAARTGPAPARARARSPSRHGTSPGRR